MHIRPVCEWFAHGFVPGPGCGLVCSVLSSRARACRRNRQVPRVPLPDVGITFIRETCTASSEDITPRSSLLRTHAPIPCGSPLLRFVASFEESVQVATRPCCYRDSPDGWDRARARRPGRWRVTVLALSVCEAGSQFHQGCVSRGPPIMPDNRISQVRFEALAFRP